MEAIVTWITTRPDGFIGGCLTVAGFFITICGFIFQFRYVEAKIHSRDQRDVFDREVNQPINALIEHIHTGAGLADRWQRNAEGPTTPVLQSELTILNRRINIVINKLSKCGFDFGDGWIEIDTVLFENAIADLDVGARRQLGDVITRRIYDLQHKLETQMDRCKPPHKR